MFLINLLHDEILDFDIAISKLKRKLIAKRQINKKSLPYQLSNHLHSHHL